MAVRDERRSSEEMERTLYVANLDERVTDEILYELMIQAGPLAYVSRPKDRPFAFIVFEDEESVPYAIALFRGIRLFDRLLDIRPRDGTEQSRKINAYMNEVHQRRRQVMSDTRDNDPRYGINAASALYNMTQPPPRFQSMTSLVGGIGYASSGYASRSTLWPHLDSSLAFLPPPPPPPPLSDFSTRRRYEDRDDRYTRDRGDHHRGYTDLDAPYRSRGNGRDSGQNQRIRSPTNDEASQKRKRKK